MTAMAFERISVIIPSHERANLCIRAVRSALAQTLPPEEVLVWDDGSSDATREQLRAFAAENPEMQLHEGPLTGTPAVGRNRLIEVARGDWVAMLDDDDEWLPDKLELQQPYMGTWDVIASGATRRSDGQVYLPHVGPVSRALLLRNNVLVLPTVTIRRSLLTLGFREERELAAIADYCLWLDLVDAGAQIVATPHLVAIYEDTGPDRLSDAVTAVQTRLARHVVQRWRRRLSDRDAAVAAAVHSWRAAKLRARELLRP